jgi:NAD(P)-dependent dehydrogenase (short-subunit alcohol dehydrogenase family)
MCPMNMTTASLADKHAVITGGATGIGAAIAQALDRAGARITLVGRTPGPLESMAQTLKSAAGRPCDVTDFDKVALTVQAAEAAMGPIDILINNAGGVAPSKFTKIAPDDWAGAIAVNLTSVYNCIHAVLPGMLARKSGRIVNVASTAGLKGYPYVAAYCAAKHGVIGLTKAIALEIAGSGVTVNCVCPGYTDTELVRRSIDTIVSKTGRSEQQALSQLTHETPIGRLMDPGEIADLVVWICGESTEAILGQSLVVAGGEVM